MIQRYYSRSQAHKNILQEWSALHQFSIDFELDIPRYGLIAIHDNQKVAVGFLREIEGGGAFLESFMTNPAANSDLRNQALDEIIRELIHRCELKGLKFLMAYTKVPSLVERCQKNHGMEIIPHVLLGRILENKGEHL